MKFCEQVFWTVFFFGLSFARSENLNNRTRHDKNKFAYADILIDALESQHWTENEQPCLNTMLDILDSAKKSTLWGVWIMDSIQQPIGHLYGQKYHLGHYDECMNPHRGFLPHAEVPKTQYCMVNVTLKEMEKSSPLNYVWKTHNYTMDAYLTKPSIHGVGFSHMSFGVCVPEVCQPSGTAKIVRSILQISHLGEVSDSASITTRHCENAESLEKLSSTGPKLFLLLLLFLITTAIFCTYYVKTGQVSPSSFGGKLAHCFSLERNIKSLTDNNEDELYCINFMRLCSCFIIVILHYCTFLAYFVGNGLDLDGLFGNYGYILNHIELVVDTFLTLSGLLFTRGLINDRWQNPLKYIWKRYMRLAAGLSMGIFFLAAVSHYLNNGPVWQVEVNYEQKICYDNWLLNVIMMGNIFDSEKLCNISTWYIPCDYQLCVFATIIFIIYKKNKNLGLLTFAIAVAFSSLIPGMLTYVNNYPALVFNGAMSVANPRLNEVFNSIYIRSYCRAGPFLAGMATGYIVYSYKPQDYRKIIGKLWSYLALVFSVALMVAINALGHYFYINNEPISVAIYVAVNRTLWGIAVCAIIGISEYGDIPVLKKIFTWNPVVTLSRLTYGVYISHGPILGFVYFSTRTPYKLDIPVMLVEATGIVFYSFVSSFLLWTLVEAPVNNITKMLLDKTWKSTSVKSNGIESNGTVRNGTKHIEKHCNGNKCDENVSNGKISNGKVYNEGKSKEIISNGKEKVL